MKVILVIFFIVFILIAITTPAKSSTLGVTFSPTYTEYLGLDVKKTYLSILDDLKVKNLRIPTYWNDTEKEPGKLNFDNIDFMVSEASKRQAKIILVVGIKQPRWPECFTPDWANKLSVSERQQKALDYIQKIVSRYQNQDNITAWQIENEPFVGWFGENCDPLDRTFLNQEIALVKKLDPNRSVVVTDTGEWSSWTDAMKSSDVLGISLYRKAHNPKFGYITYPFFPTMYTVKSTVIKGLFAPQNQKTIITELQAEPWTQNGIIDTSVIDQTKLFPAQDLQNNLEYAKRTGINEIYLWGVEWWYYMASEGHPEYLELVKNLLK